MQVITGLCTVHVYTCVLSAPHRGLGHRGPGLRAGPQAQPRPHTRQLLPEVPPSGKTREQPLNVRSDPDKDIVKLLMMHGSASFERVCTNFSVNEIKLCE